MIRKYLVALIGALVALWLPAHAQQRAPALTSNSLIEQLQKATPDGERLIELRGYVGPSTPETVKLYRSLSLANYYEIPRNAIVNVVQEGDPKTGPVKLFVRGSATIVHATRLSAGMFSSSRQAGASRLGSAGPDSVFSSHSAKALLGARLRLAEEEGWPICGSLGSLCVCSPFATCCLDGTNCYCIYGPCAH